MYIFYTYFIYLNCIFFLQFILLLWIIDIVKINNVIEKFYHILFIIIEKIYIEIRRNNNGNKL